MARVIKGGIGGSAKPARPATRVLANADAKKVIDKESYVARQEADALLKDAEQERRQIFADGKRRAAQAREESMARGASDAFAAAAAEALTAFRRRAERYAEAADDIRTLALEIVKKVLGSESVLPPGAVEKILQKGMAQLRARRRLRVQVPAGRRGELLLERPKMMKALDAEPDLVIEDADDVGDGFARVVTEVGGALCSESTALDALAVAVDVHEQPRVARFSADVSLRGPAAGAPSALDLPEASVFEALSADEGGAENLPHDDEADEHSISEEETQAFHQVTRPPQAPAPRASSTAVAGPRFSTTPRAVGHDERESHLRQAGSLVAAPPSRSPRTDEDLDLFTDDKPVTPRRR